MIRRFAIPLVLSVALGGEAQAQALVTKLNTGYDGTTQMPNGTLDSRYVIAAGGTGGQIGATPMVRSSPIPSSWLADSASSLSRWLVLPGSGLEGITVNSGTFIFQTTVDLTGYTPSSAMITGLQYAADNKLVGVSINGTSVYSQPQTFAEEFSSFHNLGTVGAGLFHDGPNTIRFIVYNDDSGSSPLGLRLEGSVMATPVPEPSSFALLSLILGLGSLAAKRRRAATCNKS